MNRWKHTAWIAIIAVAWAAHPQSLGQAPPEPAPAASRGTPASPPAAAIQVTGIVHAVNYLDPDHIDECTLTATMAFAPGVAPASFAGRVRPDLAVDENGLSLVPPPPPLNADRRARSAGPAGSLVGGFSQNPLPAVLPEVIPVNPAAPSTFQIVLAVPRQAGHRIAQVKGRAHLFVPGKAQIVEIPVTELAAGQTVDFHGTKVKISGNVGTGRAITTTVGLTIARGSLDDAAWQALQDLSESITFNVYDAQGTPFSRNLGRGAHGGQQITLSAAFMATSPGRGTPPPEGAPGKCVISLPEDLKDVTVAFEFKDLPLP